MRPGSAGTRRTMPSDSNRGFAPIALQRPKSAMTMRVRGQVSARPTEKNQNATHTFDFWLTTRLATQLLFFLPDI